MSTLTVQINSAVTLYTRMVTVLARCRWYELVLAAEEDIATIMTMEGGKPLKESKGEFASG